MAALSDTARRRPHSAKSTPASAPRTAHVSLAVAWQQNRAVRCHPLSDLPPAVRVLVPLVIGVAAATLAACAGPRVAIETQESFDSTATFSRTYAALMSATCEAGRRALLSQGYVIGIATSEQVRGRKSFQPGPEAHAEVEVTIVCAREGFAGRRTIAFVNAVQENFSLKKSNNSASVGVSPFGSVSLPFTGSDESLVKVASSTITSAPFYDRFFQLLERYLAGDPGQPMPPPAPVDNEPPEPIEAVKAAAPASAPSAAASAASSP